MVEWKALEELGPYFGGLTGKTKDDFVDGNARFITYMNVFANPALDVFNTGVVRINKGEKQNRIQKGDILFTGSSETPEEAGMSCVVTDELEGDFYMNSFCFGLRLISPEQYNLHYLKHLLRSESVRKSIAKTASGVTRFNISKARFSKIRIPIPSLEEQTRIVGILDTFTSAIDNLKEQIAQRRKQYEYYRDQLLDLEGKPGVEKKKLEEILNVRKGEYITKKEANEGIYPVILGGKEPAYFIDRYNHTGKAIVISRSGASAGYVSFWNEPIFVTDGFLIEPKENVIFEYLYYVLKSKQRDLQNTKKGGAIPHITPSLIVSLNTVLPDFPTQSRIVSTLDTFEASIANLEAHLKQREKQYEYYRNKLLTFE